MRFRAIVVFSVLVCSIGANSVSAQLFSGPSSFTMAPATGAPNSQFLNNLTLTDLANGFSVSGQVQIDVTAGQHSGTLLSWEVERPLNPLFTPPMTMVNTSSLTGYIIAPASAGSDYGQITTEYTATPSMAIGTFSYSGGVQTQLNVSQTATFPYTAGGVNFLRQAYFVNYNFNVPAGTYVLDFPADSLSDPLPEPTTCVTAAILTGGLLNRPRRRRR